MNTGRPGQKKQLSRKGKKAWRKNIDLDELEQGREDVRDAEIVLGAGPLFELDTKGSEKDLTNAMKQEKRLKSHEILHKRSAVPALESSHKKKDVQKKKAKLHDLLRKSGRTGEDTKVVAIEKDGLNRSEAFDLWDAPSAGPSTASKKHKPLAPQAPVQGAATVEIPHAGKSYNPNKDDWSSLVASEHARLAKLEEEREAVEAEEARIQALIEAGEEEESEEEESEEEIKPFTGRLSVNPAAEYKKKTKTQINKARRHAEQMKLHKRLRELKKQAAELEQLRESDFDLLKPGAPKPKKYRGLKSKHALYEQPLEVKLSDEMEGSLRRLVPEGNLAKDRFRSLQMRGIIESRVPVKQKSRYPKVVKQKWTYKDFNKNRVHGEK